MLNTHAIDSGDAREVTEEQRRGIAGDGSSAIASDQERLRETGHRKVAHGSSGVLVGADARTGVTGDLHTILQRKRSAIQANAATQDGDRRTIILDLVRTIHGDFAHADDIHAEDVVPLHDGDGRSALGYTPAPSKRTELPMT